MSNVALTWAFSLSIKPATRKFVLVALADAANHQHEAYPSVATICAMTCLDRKTVLAALTELREMGVIQDTGKRVGATHQVPVYRMMLEAPTAPQAAAPLADSGRVNCPENGTVVLNCPENGTVPILRGNSPVFPAEQSRSSVGTVPQTGHGTPSIPKEPQRTQRESTPTPSRTFSTSKRTSMIASDWKPSEATITWIEKTFPLLDVQTVIATIEKFRDYYTAQGDPKADWDAQFRYWLRRDMEHPVAAPRPSGLPVASTPRRGSGHLTNEEAAANVARLSTNFFAAQG